MNLDCNNYFNKCDYIIYVHNSVYIGLKRLGFMVFVTVILASS